MIKPFSKLHPKYGTPYISIIICGLASLVISIFLPFSVLVILATVIYVAFYIILFMGTYFKRKKYPNLESEYKIPLGTKGVFIMMAIPSTLVIRAVLQESISYILIGIILNISTPIIYKLFNKVYGGEKNKVEEI